jgi:acyl-CoA thioesterase FadM
MTFARRLEHGYRVRFDEAGPDGLLRASGYLRFAQDLAWLHSESGGFGREWYAERGLTWLVRAIELDIVGEFVYGAQLTVSTEVIGFRRVWARRRSEFMEHGSERKVATAITDWVLLNERARPVRPPAEILDAFTPVEADFTPLRIPAVDPATDAARVEFGARRSELDPMAHVNNAVYIDYLDELYSATSNSLSLPAPRRYRAEFLASAEHGATLVGRGWPDGQGWSYLLEEAERPLLRARLETDPATWVGG